MRQILFPLLLLTLGGCANFAERSVGAIGCPEEDIKIAQELSSSSWVAECRGKRFICQAFGDANGNHTSTQCAEEIPKK